MIFIKLILQTNNDFLKNTPKKYEYIKKTY